MMAMEFALRFMANQKSWSTFGTGAPGLRFGAADGFLIASSPRVTLPLRRSFKVIVHVADPDSAVQIPSKALAKEKLDVTSQTKAEKHLLKDLQDFILSCDLPPDEVPSPPELARHGRQDLANRVRRRGYKRMAQLLQQDDVGRLGGGELEEASLRGSAPSGAPANGHLMSVEDSVRDAEGDYSASLLETGDDLALEETTAVSRMSSDESTRSIDLDIGTKASSALKALREDDKTGEARAEHEIDQEEESIPDVRKIEDDGVEDELQILGVSPSNLPSREIALKKAALLKAKLLQFLDGRHLDMRIEETVPNLEAEENGAIGHAPIQAIQSDDIPQISNEVDYKGELERLKSLLRSRESELAEVMRQLDEAQAILALARSKASAELRHIKQLAAERDVRSNPGEQAISQMKTVHLEWWGGAGRVEVAGSFNGWEHHILLEPYPSSEIPKPDGSRGSLMWGTYLCLYPGVYEIKFIVDGKWQVDHRREVVFRDIFQNNLLRVD